MSTTTTDGKQAVDAALQLLNAVKSDVWIPSGFKKGDLATLSATMRPIDDLHTAGLDWLVPYVQPLQVVLDQMAGQAAVIQAYFEHWQQTADKVEDIRAQLAKLDAGDESQWSGGAAEEYAARMQEIADALESATHVCAAMGEYTIRMGQVLADARQQAGDLVTTLVRNLISYAQQASAASGSSGPDSTVMAQCTSMINECGQQVAALQQRLEQALGNIQPPTSAPVAPPGGPDAYDIVDLISNLISALDMIKGVARAWRMIRSMLRFGQRVKPSNLPAQLPPPGRPTVPLPMLPKGPYKEVTTGQMIKAIRDSPKMQMGTVPPPKNWPPTSKDGYDMQAATDAVVRQRWPNVHFESAQRGAGGPDMRVTGWDPGTPDPGFRWVEIKPDSAGGVGTFVRDEWGTTPAWSGNGRLVVWDKNGNVSEVDFPIH